MIIKNLIRKRYFWIYEFFFNFWPQLTEVQRIPTNINFLLSLSSTTCFHRKAILKINVLIFCRRRPNDDIFRSKPVVLENNNKNTENDKRYQLDATILFIIINKSTCFGNLYAHLQEYIGCILLHMVFSTRYCGRGPEDPVCSLVHCV